MSGDRKILDEGFIEKFILREATLAEGHGADPERNFLGAGLLYYAIAYSLQAKLCVCLGSGGGFVPRIMRQAQRDLGLEDAETILVDADTGEWSRPNYLEGDSFFRSEYGDVRIIVDLSANAARAGRAAGWRIDFLHIDADHSHAGSLADFENYKPLMSPRGIITFHDTRPYEYFNITCWKTLDDIRRQGHRVIDLPWLGSGTAIVQLEPEPGRAEAYTPFHARYARNLLSTLRDRALRLARLSPREG